MADTILVSNVENNYCFSQRINEITVYQRPYIRTILNKLSETSQDNANLICDYIINEQNTFNIKESTKEGKIKFLSGYQIISRMRKNSLIMKNNHG